MIITKKTIDRRTVLRGIGVSLALPLLDSMVPPLTALSQTAANPIKRLGVVYLPNGVVMQEWTPATDGKAYQLTPILKPLEAFQDRFALISGLTNIGGIISSGVHARASTKFLTGVSPKHTAGSELLAGLSIDQMAARVLGQHTQLASLELSLESGDTGAGTCDVGFSCVYTNTIAWRSPTTPLPMESNPRAVFERLFGDTGTTDAKTRLARVRKDRSILDSVTQKVAQLRNTLGPDDGVKLSEYLEAIRDIERRIQKAEEQGARELPQMDQPVGVPASFEEHIRLMFDLQVLAYQSDLTRVITFMVGREFSGRSYPEIGIPDAHHPLSHHQNDPQKLAKLAQLNTYQATQFAYFLDKLQSTPDGDGSLLDHSLILYGAGMSDSNVHSPMNLPVLLAGGGTGRLKGGRHLRYPGETPMANLLVTLLDKLDVPVEQVADSTGKLQELSEV